jgi:hypothetical protein
MVRHLGVGSVETGIVAIQVGDGGFEIIADHELRRHCDPRGEAETPEGQGEG